ncbi:substrate-binding domain-containing protein [Anatilimnocola sp. NA78]|uniref:substrate-binding domain-containing protein n=1 Tax=Anatilimnocola sp. NA78 TaxID=3415683 RepID=UPI003CE4C016
MLCKMLRPGFALVAATLLIFAAGCKSESNPNANSGAGASAGSGKRFVFLINTPNDYWNACKAGLVEGEKEFQLKDAGLSISMESNDGTAQGQVDSLRQFGTQSDIVGVALTVVQADNAAIVDEMKKLQAKGVKVFTVDGDVNRDKFRDARPYYIGTNNIEAGKLLGAATKKVLEARKVDKGAYVQFAGYTDNDNARNRMNGVKEGLGSSYEDRDRMSDETDYNRAQENVRIALTNHADLVALVGIWAYNGPEIAVVVNQRKARDQVAVVTFDADSRSIEAMEAGNMDVMCVQDPYKMGLQAVKLLKAMHLDDQATIKEMFPNAGQPDGDIYTTGLKLVVPDAGSPLKKEDYAGSDIEFLTVSEMKAWLKKLGLKSS